MIGIHDDGIEEISKSETLIDILDLDDSQTSGFAQKYALHREETRKFCLFLHNLRRCVHDRKSNKVMTEDILQKKLNFRSQCFIFY